MEANQIEEKVKMILADVLGLDEDEVDQITPYAHLVDDLATESIDFIDICFRLEKDLGIGKVNPDHIFPNFLREQEIVDKAGMLKEEKKSAALERLSKDYPHLNNTLLQELKQTNNARVLLTMKNIAEFADYRLNHNS